MGGTHFSWASSDGPSSDGVTEDHLARAEAYAVRQQRDRPVAVSVMSRTPVADLAGKDAPTWLDRELSEGSGNPVRDAGFGREVRAALAARRQWLVEQQLADPDGAALRFRQGTIDVLRQRELRQAGAQLAEGVGKSFASAGIGERIEGTIARRIDLEGGSYALVERSRDFTLVPWRDVLERNMGKAASGIMRADGISWQFGRGRSGPVIS
ncbi:DUF3363 domain-containing protein [Sphingobium sp. WCS2017Hpa-17]|uniref:DUF3363 domain-containing protein n=1 Tax=Sphingobium sp. WCS2017Hpa-17 TaxID=3073638 RepID=UPI0028892229|nr:DUF3363 domain-containing protein [Sphingobium sp. WCS2017Hpa-17]